MENALGKQEAVNFCAVVDIGAKGSTCFHLSKTYSPVVFLVSWLPNFSIRFN